MTTSGFTLHFGKEGCTFMRCYLAAGSFPPDVPGFAFTTVRIVHPGGEAVITAATTEAELAQWFGEPAVREKVDDETSLE